MNKQINGNRFFTVQEKCAVFTNPAVINARLAKINRDRGIAFMEIFLDKKVEKQVIFKFAEDVIPYNGYSFYKIDYVGEYPPKLIAAYKEMNGLNLSSPRKAYVKKRIRLKMK